MNPHPSDLKPLLFLLLPYPATTLVFIIYPFLIAGQIYSFVLPSPSNVHDTDNLESLRSTHIRHDWRGYNADHIVVEIF